MNKMQAIKIAKLTLNIGAGRDEKVLKKAVKLLENITGIPPVQTTTKKRLAAWAEKQEIPFSVAPLTGGVAEIRFDWNVQSLPWLILTDKQHVVRAEGFGISELAQKIQDVKGM